MKFLQKLGKALMLPVACLPICGILMGIGYALCPATMQGGDITGIGNQIGFFLVKAGGALMDNMAAMRDCQQNISVYRRIHSSNTNNSLAVRWQWIK